MAVAVTTRVIKSDRFQALKYVVDVVITMKIIASSCHSTLLCVSECCVNLADTVLGAERDSLNYFKSVYLCVLLTDLWEQAHWSFREKTGQQID